MNIPMRPPFLRRGWWYAEFGGKRVSLRTKNEKEARRAYETLRKAYLSRRLAVLTDQPTSKRLVDLVEEFLEYSQQTKRPFTYQTDRQALRRAQEYFGRLTPLSSISSRLVDKWLAEMGQEVKRTSANTWFRHFKAAMSKAVEWGYLKKNPAQGVKQLAVDEALPRYLEQEEFQAFLRAEPDPDFRRLWELYLRTGCRRSELLQVTVEDINWQSRVILVKRTKGRRPKPVPITPEVEQLIREIQVQVGKLFPWTPDYVTHRFKKWSRAAGLECRLHDLRHTYGSWLVQAGVEIKVLKDLMGHRDVKTTEIYAHLKLEQLAKASEKIKVEKP